MVGHQTSYCQGARRDVGRDPGRLLQAVIAQQGTARSCHIGPRHGHRYGVGHVPRSENATHARGVERQAFSSHGARQCRACRVEHHRGGAVIDLVAGGHARHRQGCWGDAGRADAGAAQRVVAQQGARTRSDQVARERRRDGQAAAHVLAGKHARSAGGVKGDRLTCHHTRQAGRARSAQRRGGATVVHLVGRHQAGDGQRCRCDVGAQARHRLQAVVAKLSSCPWGQCAGGVGDRHRNTRADILAGKSAVGTRSTDADAVTRHDARH